jgi:serine/threonine-protein kinase
MGEIWLARQSGGFDRLVVLKRVISSEEEDPSNLTMFLDEARIASQLHHPNVVQVFELGQGGGSFYLAMEYLAGQTVSRFARRLAEKQGAVPQTLAVQVIASAARGLGYAHRRTDLEGRALHIVHRDVSPQNLFITYDGQVKVLDFGIARAAGRMNKTATGVVRGKVAYMAPEQAVGEPLSGASDVFSLGVVLLELVTGRRAWADLDEVGILRKLAAFEVPQRASQVLTIDADLDALIAQAVDPVPENRFADGQAFADALDRWARMHVARHEPTLEARMRELFSPEVSALGEFHKLAALTPSASSMPNGAATGPRPEVPKKAPATSAGAAEPHPARSKPSRLALSLGALFLLVGVGAMWWGVVRPDADPLVDLRAASPVTLPKRGDALTPAQPAPPSAVPLRSEARPMVTAPPPVATSRPALPRAATGVPATFVVSAADHGLEMGTVGMPVNVTGAGWSARLESTRRRALFFVPGTGPAHELRLLGKDWSPIEDGGGRLFAVRPPGLKWDPRETLALQLGKRTEHGVAAVSSAFIPRVAAEAFVIVETRQFVLDGLERLKRYRVSSRASGSGPAGPVLVVLNENRSKLEPGVSVPGPPAQALVPPGGTIEVWNAESLAVLLLTWPDDAKDRQVEVSVNEVSPGVVIDRNSAEAQALDARLNAASVPNASPGVRRSDSSTSLGIGASLTCDNPEGCMNAGVMQTTHGRPDLAIPYYQHCLVIAPGNPDCTVLLKRAQEKLGK